MSIDACKITNSTSILLKKIKPTPPPTTIKKRKDDDVVVAVATKNKGKKSSSFSNKLQSVGLSLAASVSKRRNEKVVVDLINKKKYYKSPTSSLPSDISIQPRLSAQEQQQQQQRGSSTNMSPIKLKPSISARPFSQFFFPIKEVVEERKQQQIKSSNNKSTKQKPRQKQKSNSSKRHSTTVIDFTIPDETYTSNSSSRSSSLKTIKNQPIVDNIIIASEAVILVDNIQSDITFSLTKRNNQLSRSTSNKLSSVARARTVLGLDSMKSRELRAIHIWKDTISQLSTEEDDEYNENENVEQEEQEEQDDLYEILSHPALMPDHPLERQRFVRQSSPKDLAMMRFILNELTATEKSYNQLLLLIQNRYMHPMIAASQAEDPLVKSTDIPILFNHLPELVQLSDRLLNQFNMTNSIGQVFRSIEQDLVVFLKYSMHYRTNIKTIRRACSNVLFVKINQENLARRDTNRLGMSDYFIAPIQRIPRYCLLIKDLQKYTHPLDTNYMELDFALKILTGLAVAMDHVQNKVTPPSRTSTRTL